MIRPRHPHSDADDLLEALDALLVALRGSTALHKSATRRALTIRRLRSHGRSYDEILRRVEGALDQRLTRESLDDLIEAGKRLDYAEVRALHHEGLGVDEITTLSGLTKGQVAKVLAAAERRDHPSRPQRPELQ